MTTFKRDDRGLIEGVTYHYTSDGRIDWRRMVEPRFLFVASDKRDKVCAEQGVTADKIDVTKVRDEWLRIRVAGLNELAQLRGIMSVEYPIVHVDSSSVTATCVIEFLPSFESSDMPFTVSAIASANLHSVDHDFTPYLATFAENRAFSRCVKRALRINILSDVEIDKVGNGGEPSAPAASDSTAPSQSSGFDGNHLLKDRCTAEKVPFKAMQDAAIAATDVEWKTPPASWTDFESVGRTDAFVIMGKMDKAKEARAGVKAKK